MLENFKKHAITYREENERIRKYFRECLPTIDDNNLYMLRKVCMYMSMVYLIMVIISEILLADYELSWIHLSVLLLILIYFNINLYTMRHRFMISTAKTAAICCTFYFILGVYLAAVDVFENPAGQAVWLPIAVICLPMIFIDRIYKYAFEELVVITIELICSYFYKSWDYFLRDAYICIVSYIVSILAARIILEMRASETLAMNEVTRLSSVDKLTHVLNKGALLERMETYFERKKPEELCAMCVIDLDNFKDVNDNLGHHIGDVLLEKVGKLLNDNFRSYDIIGRYGGDEFVVVMPRMEEISTLETRCKALQMFISEINLGNSQPFTVSIGGIISKGVEDVHKIFAMADDALYKSKILGKNNITAWIYDEEPHDKTILICVCAEAHPGVNLLKDEEKERFEILLANDDSETVRLVSQYHENVGLICIELNDVTGLGVFTMKYLKTRESFANIPILAIVDTEDEEKLAKDLKADIVLHFDDDPKIFRDSIEKLVRV